MHARGVAAVEMKPSTGIGIALVSALTLASEGLRSDAKQAGSSGAAGGTRTPRGITPARTRPALGLALDRMRIADVQSWAAARGLACETRYRPASVVTCTDVPMAALWPGRTTGKIDELAFAFASDGRLVAVESVRRGLSSAEASRLFERIARDLATALGSNGERAGSSRAKDLAAAPTRAARLQYRFSDYAATVIAMNLDGQIALFEQYQSVL
jgi:hypothetical protein